MKEAPTTDAEDPDENMKPHMCGCQNYGPLLGPPNTRCRILLSTQKRDPNLTTTDIRGMSEVACDLKNAKSQGGSLGARRGPQGPAVMVEGMVIPKHHKPLESPSIMPQKLAHSCFGGPCLALKPGTLQVYVRSTWEAAAGRQPWREGRRGLHGHAALQCQNDLG